MKYSSVTALGLFVVALSSTEAFAENRSEPLRGRVVAAMKSASVFYVRKVSSHGGYVYFYSVDLTKRWGEGVATRDQVWVQPPGTPTVGLAYLAAYKATSDPFYLDAAKQAAEAIVYGQLKSGGWTNCVDFDPRGRRSAAYRNGKGRGKNNSSFDDGQSQSAMRLLIAVDEALEFKNRKIHQSAEIALKALLAAQFTNGGFPQVWTKPVSKQPVRKASYPSYDWRTEGRIKNYWDMYTLNDNVCGYIAQTLIDAHHIYKDEKYLAALKRLGDFLILAQMPAPQPGWAQQYNYEMKPIWARKFEPPGVSGDESQEAVETLLQIFQITGDRKYLKPIPAALTYLKRSLLKDGRLARYYELKTNRPLYMQRSGKRYTLTYDDSRLPRHYGWKIVSRLKQLESRYKLLAAKRSISNSPRSRAELEPAVRRILKTLDQQGRWIQTANGERLVGQPRFPLKTRYISSEVFSRNLETLSAYLQATMSQK
jgi:PelA/Pel-15E family pectate lyase